MILYFLGATRANRIIIMQERPGEHCAPKKPKEAYCGYNVNHLIINYISPEMKASCRY